MNHPINKNEYSALLKSIKKRIHAAQYEALKAVNKEHIRLYWDLGKMIVERQTKYKWGKAVVQNLAQDLQLSFPGVKGFSADNLWRMRKLYLRYSGDQKLAPLVQEISWSKNIVVMEKCNLTL